MKMRRSLFGMLVTAVLVVSLFWGYTLSGATGTQYTAEGTYSYVPTTLTVNWTSSNFPPGWGPTAGANETDTGVVVAATTMSMPTSEMTWTRSSGTPGDITGAWTANDQINSFQLTFNPNNTVVLTMTPWVLANSDAQITGSVTEYGTGNPIAGAAIDGKTLDNMESVTVVNADGTYALPVVSGKEWVIRGQEPAGYFGMRTGGFSDNTRITPSQAGPNIVNFTAHKETAWIDGTVMTEDGIGSPVEGALFYANRINDPSLQNLSNGHYSGPTGTVTVGVKAGDWRVGLCMNCHDHPVRVNGVQKELVPPSEVEVFGLQFNEHRSVTINAYYADGAVEGTVFRDDGSTPGPAGIRIDAYAENAKNGQTPIGHLNASAETDENGNFRLPLVDGTWHVRASMYDWGKQSLEETIYLNTNGNEVIEAAEVINQNFTLNLPINPGGGGGGGGTSLDAYTISGTVSYPSGTQTGRIYINVNWQNGGDTPYGTSIASAGTFTIRGVQPGNYTLSAWMDNRNTGARNASNPGGNSDPLNVSGEMEIIGGAAITLTDPTPSAPVTPTNVGIQPANSSAFIFWDGDYNANDLETATSYIIYWGTNTNASSGGGQITVTAKDDQYYFQSVPNGVYYYKISARIGTNESAPSEVVGPVTVGPVTGPNTVSGTISGIPAATGPLYVGLHNDELGIFFTRIASPSSSQTFTISAVPAGTFHEFAFVDQNNNGVRNPGEPAICINDSGCSVVSVAGDTANRNHTFSTANALAEVTTNHGKSGPYDNYNVNIRVSGGMKRVVSMAVTAGPNIITPTDIGKRWGFEGWFGTGSTRPNVGDNYSLYLTYSDGTTETLTASVTGVLDSFATDLAPQGGIAYVSQPIFAWGAPSPAPAGEYTYSLRVWGEGNGMWWSPDIDFPSSQLSFDSLDTSLNLQDGQTYKWSISVRDANGNSAENTKGFTFLGAIKNVVTTSLGMGISGVSVSAYDSSGNPTDKGCTTGGNGTCTILGLDDGSYKLYYNGSSAGYMNQWYDGASDIAGATPVSVLTHNTTEVNVQLSQGVQVTAISNGNGTITPTMQQVPSGNTATLTLTPDSGYAIGNVSSTCGGTLNGNVFTTGAVTSDCTVTATFAVLQYTVTPGSLTFHSPLNITTAAKTVTVTNSAPTALSITGITLGGSNSSQFGQTSTCEASLASGATCTVSVTFKPTTPNPATKNALLSVNVASPGVSQSVSLTGTIDTPKLSPTVLTFHAPLQVQSAAKTVTVTNSGATELSITGITLGGSNSSQFGQTSTCEASLASGASCTVSVTFKPTTSNPATKSALLSVNVASPGVSQSVSLTGTIDTPKLSPTALTFNAPLNGQSADRTVTVTNIGATELSITGITLGGSNPGQFKQTNNTCGTSLASGASCTVSVIFKPTFLFPATRTATLNVNAAAPGVSQSVSLTGKLQ